MFGSVFLQTYISLREESRNGNLSGNYILASQINFLMENFDLTLFEDERKEIHMTYEKILSNKV